MIGLNLKFLLFNICLLFTVPVSATTISKLYEVSVPVFSQSIAERETATDKAFVELLIRITGKRDILGMESSQALITDSKRFVRSFRYEILPPPVVFESSTVNPAEEEASDSSMLSFKKEKEEENLPTQKIVVSFDEKAIKNSLWKLKLPVWGKIRPSTLLWIAIQDQKSRTLLDSSQQTEVLALVKQHAEKRGVPIVYPLLDLEDQLKINVTDVWGSYKLPVTEASLRYKPEAVISGKLFLDESGIWQARWNLYQAGDETNWQFSAPHLSVVIFESIDKLAEKLAERYAQVSSGDDSRFLIHISDVSNLKDYKKINRYLKSLSAIKRVELSQIQGNELIYELDLRSNPKALKQAIALGKTLAAMDDPFASEVDANRFNYRLKP